MPADSIIYLRVPFWCGSPWIVSQVDSIHPVSWPSAFIRGQFFISFTDPRTIKGHDSTHRLVSNFVKPMEIKRKRKKERKKAIKKTALFVSR
jgi:hypothetical protein